MTPFGRQPVTLGLLATHALAQSVHTASAFDKWALLRDVMAARRDFGNSDRGLVVLSALLSFHPKKERSSSDALVVFPSNLSPSERPHGMPESTLRRHLAALVRAGLILRRDSPNGKRYVRRGPNGLHRAFGFDLKPLLAQVDKIELAAANAHEAEREIKRHREQV